MENHNLMAILFVIFWMSVGTIGVFFPLKLLKFASRMAGQEYPASYLPTMKFSGAGMIFVSLIVFYVVIRGVFVRT